MTRIRFIALAVGVLAAAAAATALAARTSPSHYSATAGPALPKLPADVSRQADSAAFFPSTITIHVGDSVTWRFDGFHTVTFPGLHKPYPFIVPAAQKQPAQTDAAGKPYWWSGTAPVLQVSPMTLAPQGGSTVADATVVESSGLTRIMGATPTHPPAPYTLTFTRVGVYHYQCAVHAGMRGVVRVVPAGVEIPTLAQQAQATRAQLAQTVADWKRLAVAAPAAPDTVWIGAGTRHGASLDEFFPKVLHVKVGDTVTFVSHDPNDVHTVTFGPNALRGSIEKTFVAPQGNPPVPTINPLGAYASDPPAAANGYDGTAHGNGYLNSGLVSPLGAPGGMHVFRIRFTKAGVYHYECVIHPNMDGTIVVA